jgi:hypothetical protein
MVDTVLQRTLLTTKEPISGQDSNSGYGDTAYEAGRKYRVKM